MTQENSGAQVVFDTDGDVELQGAYTELTQSLAGQIGGATQFLSGTMMKKLGTNCAHCETIVVTHALVDLLGAILATSVKDGEPRKQLVEALLVYLNARTHEHAVVHAAYQQATAQANDDFPQPVNIRPV